MGFYDDIKQELSGLVPLEKDFARIAIQYSRLHHDGMIPNTPKEESDKLLARLVETMEQMQTPEEIRRKHLLVFSEIIKNPASAIFMDMMQAPESEFFAQWLRDSMQAQAMALEPAYHWGRDLNGVYRQIPKLDPAYTMADDTGYKFTHWRDEMANQQLKELAGANIVSIAQGLMPEIRHIDYPWSVLETQKFYCYDPANINLQDYFCEDISQIIYQKRMNLDGAIREEVKMMDLREIDMILIKGYLSYVLDKLSVIVPTAVKLLKPGGIFSFDLEVANFTMVRNSWIFMWAQADGINFKLIDNVASIKPAIEKILAEYDIPAEAEITIAPGVDPVGAFVTIRKSP